MQEVIDTFTDMSPFIFMSGWTISIGSPLQTYTSC